MTGASPVLLAAGVMLAGGVMAVLAWGIYSLYLHRVERRLARRKGLYRRLVTGLADRERALLEPAIRQMRTLYDLEALEAVLEEQARTATGRPEWLLEVYDRLGLVDKYIDRLRNGGKWRDRAFAAELLGRVGNAKAVPALLGTVQATQTEDSDVREIALRALARIGDPGAVNPLIDALARAEPWLAPRIADILARHGDAAVDPLIQLLSRSERSSARAWAANALGEIRAHRSFPLLVRSLDDRDDEVRAKSATALARLADARAVRPLLEHLLSDPAPYVRARIATALGQFGGPEVINQLIRALGDSAWWVRMRGVEALERIGPSAEGPLLLAVNDPDGEIRRRAAVALERLGLTASLIRAIDQDQSPDASQSLAQIVSAGTPELVTELLLHPSPRVRQVVLRAIRESRRGDVGPEVIRLAASDPEPDIRALALESLRVTAAGDAAAVAIAGAAPTEDQRVRLAAIRLLGELTGPDVLTALRSSSTDPSPEIRAAAAHALASSAGTAAEPDLARLAEDADPTVVQSAIGATAQSGIRALLPAARIRIEDSDPGVQQAAIRAVSQMGDRSATDSLLRLFPRVDPALQHTIVLAMSRLDPDMVSTLIDSLVDRDDVASRLALARTLGRLRWARALDDLVRLAGDADPGVRAAAIDAIGRCTLEAPLPTSVAGALADALHDGDATVRARAVDVCSRLSLHPISPELVTLLETDSDPVVRERSALAIGLLRSERGEQALVTACRRPEEPAAVRAAAALAAGAYSRDSMVTLILEMADQDAVRRLLRERLKHDACFRLLGRRLPRTSDIELRAIAAAPGRESLPIAEGMQRILDAGERVRLIRGLRVFQDEPSRNALIQIARADPSAEVRTAAVSSVAEFLDPDESLSLGSRALGDPNLLVRRAAVGLFQRIPPERSFPRLLATLRPGEDPGVLAAVAELAEAHFPEFRSAAERIPLRDSRAVLVARISRHIRHPDLVRLLVFLSRSDNPEVREAVVEVWRHRPDVSDPGALDTLAMDPAVSVRLLVAAAGAAAERYDLLDRMTQDPDPGVRREVAITLGQADAVGEPGLVVLGHLENDQEMMVRAAAHVARLLQGVPVPLPPGLEPRVAAEAVQDTGKLATLRVTARTAVEDERRLAAALALALVHDEVAREVARTDPAPSIRHRVAGALELSLPETSGEPA